MTTIELGEIDSAPDPGPATEFSRRLGRRGTIAATALACLVGITGSAHGSGAPDIRPLWSVPIADSDGTTLSADTAYLQRTTAGRSHLSAYDLRTGKMRWETTMDGTLGYTQLADAAGLLLLPIDPTATPTDDIRYAQFSKATTALDARTGVARWTAAGEPMLVSDRTALMVDYGTDGVYVRLRLITLDPAAPRVLWSDDTPGVDSVAFQTTGTRADRIITVARDGFVRVTRFADGALLAGARIPWDPAPGDGEFNDIAPAGDHLVVNRARANSSELSVYRLDTLAEVWRAGTTGRGFAFPCGTGICFDDGNGVAGYDPDTGRKRWQLDGVSNGWSAGPDRLVAQKEGNIQQLYDADTGQPVGAPSEGETVWTIEPGSALVVLRPTHEPPDHTSITRWDLATGRHELLGAVSTLSVNRCQLVPHYLGCYQGHEFVVTAVGW
ncbi:PQQ-binding-like beta-propeller repeat protein [Actinoplanes sp. NPDC026619]|uniref:outer membrane protein assembly factor BamB family protein n=1 Tax=Actinoplanes sp. NPDC026619 TaxID=3155798 RepID=UPI0033EF24AC